MIGNKGTRAVDIDCPRCKTPAGTYCNGLGIGVDLCRQRIIAAAKKTREENRAARNRRPNTDVG